LTRRTTKSSNGEQKIELAETLLCPRCGEPVSWISKKKRGNRYYLYAIHYHGLKNGKRIEVEHYLGPADGYIHAETINELGLTHGAETDRFIKYLHRIVEDYLTRDHFNINEGLKILDEIAKLLKSKARTEEDKQKILDKLKELIEESKQEK